MTFNVMLHVTVLAVVQPVHEEKMLAPEVAGAVRVTAVPALYVREKLVDPLAALLLSAGETVMATPLAGLAEFTVRTYVTGGGGFEVVPLPPLPHPFSNRPAILAIKGANVFRITIEPQLSPHAPQRLGTSRFHSSC